MHFKHKFEILKTTNFSPNAILIFHPLIRPIPMINCCKRFTYSLPLEPSEHKLTLYKSVRAAELSIIQSLDLHIPDGRLEVCGEASRSTPSICLLSWLSLMEIPLVFGGKKAKKKKTTLSFATHKQKHKRNGNAGFGGGPVHK